MDFSVSAVRAECRNQADQRLPSKVGLSDVRCRIVRAVGFKYCKRGYNDDKRMKWAFDLKSSFVKSFPLVHRKQCGSIELKINFSSSMCRSDNIIMRGTRKDDSSVRTSNLFIFCLKDVFEEFGYDRQKRLGRTVPCPKSND